MGTTLTTQPGPRVVSMDQFRGFTVLSMFAVHYSGLFPFRVPALTHNNTYLSFADTVLPAFLFASGFALRLSIFRWIAKRGRVAAYARTARRALLLILLLQLFIWERWAPRVRDMYQSGGPWAALDVLLKGGVWESLSVIGLTTLWVLPVIAASAWVRVAFLLAGLVVHALLCQQFYFAYLFGQANWLDEWLGVKGQTGYEGGILGALTWAVPFLTGSLVYDFVAQGPNRRVVRILLACSAALLAAGYCLSCLANLYPLARAPTTKEYELVEAGDIANSPVVPPASAWSDASLSSLAAEPPLVQPPADRQRQLNYWLMSKRVVTPSFVLTATGYALGVYALFILFCDLMPFQIGALRTFGQNPLATYILELFILNGLVRRIWPDDSTTALALGHCVVWFALTYLCVRLLESRGLYLRL
jgi:predicted acyltransferase